MDAITKYLPRYIIPDWDSKGNHQQFIMKPDGSWIDCYNDCERSAWWVEHHIAPYFKLAPDDISLEEYLKTK